MLEKVFETLGERVRIKRDHGAREGFFQLGEPIEAGDVVTKRDGRTLDFVQVFPEPNPSVLEAIEGRRIDERNPPIKVHRRVHVGPFIRYNGEIAGVHEFSGDFRPTKIVSLIDSKPSYEDYREGLQRAGYEVF